VLDENRVGGFDYAILAANDAGALGKWLKKRGYYFSPALKEWVKPYLKKGWKITAFKVAKKDTAAPDVGTSAVRMSFKTRRPFFPYREPKEDDEGEAVQKKKPQHQDDEDGEAEPVKKKKRFTSSRLLRVFFLSTARVEGTQGWKGMGWPGEVAWANQVKAEDRKQLLKLLKLPAKTGPASWWLTEFEDHSSPREGDADVYFVRSEDQRTVERAPHIRYVSAALPGCVMCYALAAYLVVPCLVRHWRRRA
jgi:hypothetical protein